MTKPWAKNKKSDNLHSLCSYLGSFPSSLANYWIEYLTDKKYLIFDPFRGRGTVMLESRLCERNVIASDLNPIALALSKAKAKHLKKDVLIKRIDQLESEYDSVIFYNEALGQEERIHLIFNPRTLAQLCYLKWALLQSKSKEDQFLVGAILGILHGSERKDGTSGYASISMPNTFSMSPEYVRRFVQSNQLSREFRDVFQILREKVEKVFEKHKSPKLEGEVFCANAKTLTTHQKLKDYLSKVDLVLTSPPYLGVVNYARQNWIRTWFMDEHEEEISNRLDDDLNHQEWIKFSKTTILEIKKFLKPSGVAVLVIGDVAKSKHSVIPIARDFANIVKEEGLFKNIWVVSDWIDDFDKTTRIWGSTKGNATATDRIVIMADINPFENNTRLNGQSTLSYKRVKEETKLFLGQ